MRIPKPLIITAICSLLPITAFASPCLDSKKLSELKSREMNYMIGRIPPAFRHAVEDQRVRLEMRVDETSSSGTCKVSEIMMIPQEDIAEATQLLDDDPAKRILLFSQGYSIPSESRLEASFTVTPANLEIEHQDILHTGSLGKLRASVEMMYAMLSQSRAEKAETATTSQPWSDTFRNKTTETCLVKFHSNGNLQQACQCRSAELERQYSERRLDNLEYVLSNPYAQATGAAKSYLTHQSSINASCELTPR